MSFSSTWTAATFVYSLLAIVICASNKRAQFEDVENCAPADCSRLGGTEYREWVFRKRVATAFRFCDKFNIEPQQCTACADAILAQTLKTSAGNRCVTPDHFKSAMKLCLHFIKDNSPPIDKELTPELKHMPLPPKNVTAVSLSGPPTASRIEVLATKNVDIHPEINTTSRPWELVDCSVKWETSDGYILYPACANLVCAAHGPPIYHADQVEECCEERSPHLGGTDWKTNCWYTAD